MEKDSLLANLGLIPQILGQTNRMMTMVTLKGNEVLNGSNSGGSAPKKGFVTARRVIAWLVMLVGLFAFANGASYFIRSDGYGAPDLQDGIVRVGFPFLIMERGGFTGVYWFSWAACIGNLLGAAFVATALIAGANWRKRRS